MYATIRACLFIPRVVLPRELPFQAAVLATNYSPSRPRARPSGRATRRQEVWRHRERLARQEVGGQLQDFPPGRARHVAEGV